jgi:hypothetical protein
LCTPRREIACAGDDRERLAEGEKRIGGRPLRIRALCRLGALIGVLAVCSSATPAFASEGGACPNEPYRVASDSTRLPGCRAYELVSPAEGAGPVTAASIYDVDDTSTYLQHGTGEGELSTDGGLLAQTLSPLDVQDNGSAVFWQTRLAMMPGTGKIEDGGAFDVFRSARTADGWTSTDLLPSGLQIPYNPGGVDKVLLGASADGSSALIQASLSLYPEAFENPQQAALGEWNGYMIYRVFADGAPPQLVTRFDRQIPENSKLPAVGPFQAVSASPDLSEVALRSVLALEANDTCNTSEPSPNLERGSMYLWNASAIDGLAQLITNFGFRSLCNSPNVAGVPAILPDGRPILTPNPDGNPGLPEHGPVVENFAAYLEEQSAITPLAGQAGGKLLAYTPDSATAYVQASEALDGNFPAAASEQIYAVSTTLGSKHGEGGTETPGVSCVSCASDQVGVTYLAMSEDGTHVLFTTDQGLWEWDAADGARLLSSVTGLTPADLVVSENGRYVMVLTSEALVPEDTNNAQDLYELSDGAAPVLLTSGSEPTSRYTMALTSFGVTHAFAAISNSGARAVYNRTPTAEGGREVIDEWDSGETTQLSPLNPQGVESEYQVQDVTGGELENVFFLGYDALVPWDTNAGQADVYDARTDGGFPFCTPGNPGPPPNTERCGRTINNANPTAPPIPAYAANLTPPRIQVPPLPADTSQPASPAAAKPLTRAQRLAEALRACHREPRKKRALCATQAKRRYGAHASKRSARGGK